MTLTIHRSHERAATLSGDSALIDRVATLSGLVSRECVDDRLRAVDANERVLLDALATAGVEPVVPSCALCAARHGRSKCAAHREASS